MGALPGARSPALRERITDAPADYNIGEGDDARVQACVGGVHGSGVQSLHPGRACGRGR
ncbi:MAG TPA: hypothetical protein VLC71_03290 [Thermomonas sp.]|nr:hypothetical protein [Thermomonas sp.]